MLPRQRLAPTLAALTLAALLPACRRSGPDASPSPASATSPAQSNTPAPVRVQVARPTQRPVPRHLRVTGQLQGYQDALVAADAAGKVIEAPVERGSRVAKGDVLVRLDERHPTLSLREAEAALALAEARLALARNDVERNAPLVKTRAIAEAEFRRLEAELAVREADLAATQARLGLARKALADCTLRAPFAGIVVERLVQPGEYVRADSRVARIVEVDRLRLVLNIPETAAATIHPGQPVTFQTAAHPGRTFEGVVRFVGGAVRDSARDLLVEAEVPNSDGLLRPGFFAEARIRTGEEPALTIPRDALHTDGNRRSVFVLEQGSLVERLVDPGESGDGWTEIRHGLAPTNEIVLRASGRLADGLPASAGQP